MAREYRLISADGHVVEPPDMWTKYLPKKFHDRAPKLVKDAKGGDAWELVPGHAPDAARTGHQRRALRQALRGPRVVRLDLRLHPAGVVHGQGPRRGAGLRRRGRRGAVPLAADHGCLHGPGGRRLPPGRARGLQHLDARRVHGGGPRAAHRAGPDARRRRPDLGQVVARRQGGGVPGRDHLGLPVGQLGPLRRGRPLLGGGPGGADAGPHPQRPAPGRQAHARARSRRRPPRPGADDRAGRDGRPGGRRVAVHVQVHLLGHLRPLPRPADGGGGVRGGMGAALPRAHGRPLLAQPDVDGIDARSCCRASTSGATGR